MLDKDIAYYKTDLITPNMSYFYVNGGKFQNVYRITKYEVKAVVLSRKQNWTVTLIDLKVYYKIMATKTA